MHQGDDQVTKADSLKDTGPSELVCTDMQLHQTVKIQDVAQRHNNQGPLDDLEGMTPINRVDSPGVVTGIRRRWNTNGEGQGDATDKEETWEDRV